MRIVRVQVYARQKYKAISGMYDVRSITLEAEIESGDGEVSAVWELQRRADQALESWIDQHVFVEPQPDPINAETPPDQKAIEDDLPF